MTVGAARASTRRRVVRIVALVVGVMVVVTGVWFARVVLPRATGYAAKIGCSARYVTGREPEAIAAAELESFGWVRVRYDDAASSVRASVLGMGRQEARVGLGGGCTLVRDGVGPRDPEASELGVGEASDAPWPRGEGPAGTDGVAGLDAAALESTVAEAIADPRTRAVVVAWDGHLVAERYAEGFDRDVRLPGWSMAKTLTNAMVGLLVGDGRLDVDAPAPVRAWHEGRDDPRAAITLAHLMQMRAGLADEEAYGPFGEGSDMLFVDSSCAERAIAKPLAHAPGTHYAYSSASANIVARLVGDHYESPEALLDDLDARLFEPLGMRHPVLEFDPSGAFVGSSFALMRPVDWARLGQLYLDDGLTQGGRVLPEGWVAFTAAPSPAAGEGQYGALVQTNVGPAGAPEQRRLPAVPPDAFEMVGHQGQSVLIVPSRRAVIVRLGLDPAAEPWDTNAFASDVLAALPEG